MSVTSTAYLKLPCTLGEGPYYHEGSGILYVFDLINQRAFSILTSSTPPTYQTIELEIYSSVIAEISARPNELLVGTKSGLAVVDRKDFSFKQVMNVWNDEDMALRMNDGAVDCAGRMWIGSMTDFHVGEKPGEGILWRIDSDLRAHVMLRNITVPNGIGWSPDNKTMYLTDSIADTIYAFDFAADTGTISGQRVFYKHEGGPHPDGLAMDDNGGLWIALWNGSSILHLNSKGDVVEEFKLPARNVTCPCFGGNDRRELYVTTAKSEIGNEVKAGNTDVDQGGTVFKLEVCVRGARKNKFVLSMT